LPAQAVRSSNDDVWGEPAGALDEGQAKSPPAGFSGQVVARLVHSNLPKLEDPGLAGDDEDSRTITSTPATDGVAPHIALAAAQSANRG